MSSRSILTGIGGAAALLCWPALAPAATLSVDDDAQQCPLAPYTSVQAAIDAAASGDTVAICPGTYVEGSGAQGTNAITIDKSLTLRGAGADLVSIKANPANGGQIAAASPVVRDGAGNIAAITGTPASPLTVDISGVTFDGNGVYSEVGVLFLDVRGSLVRSRVTRVVTSEAADANTIPGGFRSNDLGYGVAHVSAAVAAPVDGARTLTIDHTRIDKYNKIGVLIDGATGDTPPLVASGIDNRGVLIANQIVGRTKCINFEANGNCSSPGTLSTGPLFGQDGVRITAGSRATLTDNTISQNLVSGTGAPTPGTPTNNANLPLGSGVRLIGAASSTFGANNIVDNAYGVLNAQLNGTAANTAVPVGAENNWWGLDPVAGANAGPAVSPSTNPPTPENPVNGTSIPDTGGGTTSNAVDFFPFRNGPQSDPNTGEFAVVDAPIPVDDLPPTVVLTTDAPTYDAGTTATLTGDAADDFGITQVSFYDGSTPLGTDSAPPFEAQLSIPADAECGTRTLTAIAEDSTGQTGGDVQDITITDPSGCVPPPPPAISIIFDNPPASIPPEGVTLKAIPMADAGVVRVDFFFGDEQTCTDTTAPYKCDILPTGADVGNQTVRAVVTDQIDQTAQAFLDVEVERFAPTGLNLRLKRAKQKHKTLRGNLRLPERVTRAQGCVGTATVTISRHREVLGGADQIPLTDRCSFRLRFSRDAIGRDTNFVARARFGGNNVLLPFSSTRRFRR